VRVVCLSARERTANACQYGRARASWLSSRSVIVVVCLMQVLRPAGEGAVVKEKIEPGAPTPSCELSPELQAASPARLSSSSTALALVLDGIARFCVQLQL
jgi:hypothetical protein